MNEMLQNIFCALHDAEYALKDKTNLNIPFQKLDECKTMLLKIEEQIMLEVSKYKELYLQKCEQEDAWKQENEKLHHQLQAIQTENTVFSIQ